MSIPYFFRLQDPATGKVLMYAGYNMYQLVSVTSQLLTEDSTFYILPGTCSSIMSGASLNNNNSSIAPFTYSPVYFGVTVGGANCTKMQVTVNPNGGNLFTVDVYDASQRKTFLQLPTADAPGGVLTTSSSPFYWTLLEVAPTFYLQTPPTAAQTTSQYVTYAAGSGFGTTSTSTGAQLFEFLNHTVFLSGTVAYPSGFPNASATFTKVTCTSQYNTAAPLSLLSDSVNGLDSFAVSVSSRVAISLLTATNTLYLGAPAGVNGLLSTDAYDSALIVQPVNSSLYTVYNYLAQSRYTAWQNPVAYAFTVPTPPSPTPSACPCPICPPPSCPPASGPTSPPCPACAPGSSPVSPPCPACPPSSGPSPPCSACPPGSASPPGTSAAAAAKSGFQFNMATVVLIAAVLALFLLVGVVAFVGWKRTASGSAKNPVREVSMTNFRGQSQQSFD